MRINLLAAVAQANLIVHSHSGVKIIGLSSVDYVRLKARFGDEYELSGADDLQTNDPQTNGNGAHNYTLHIRRKENA